MSSNIIGERIKEVRNEYELSQSEFGKGISVSQDTVSLWEKGKSLPNTEYIILICTKYNVSADYLLGIID